MIGDKKTTVHSKPIFRFTADRAGRTRISEKGTGGLGDYVDELPNIRYASSHGSDHQTNLLVARRISAVDAAHFQSVSNFTDGKYIGSDPHGDVVLLTYFIDIVKR